jgi:drug/metabolite transporter (DMT)-like permease
MGIIIAVLRDSERAAELMLLIVVCIWGANFIVIKSAFRDMPPLAFNAVRMTVAALVLGVIWGVREREKTMPWSDWLSLFGVGLLGNTIYQLLFVTGLDLTTSGVSSLLIGTIPIWAALLAMALGWEQITPRTWLGIFLAFGGVALVTLGSPSGLAKNTVVGNALTLLAAACWAGYTVLSKRLLEKYSALRVSAVGLLLGSSGPVALRCVRFALARLARALPQSVGQHPVRRGHLRCLGVHHLVAWGSEARRGAHRRLQ